MGYKQGEPCPQCGGAVRIELTPHLTHHARFRCSRCNCHVEWMPKPRPEGAPRRRGASSKELVVRYGQGYCEMCLRKVEELPIKEVLIGHHVIPWSKGGSDARENVWIVCTSCHGLIHHQRTYLGHYHQREEESRNT